MSYEYWACAGITAISALVSLGFSVTGLGRGDSVSRTASMYAFARSLALAAVAIVALFTGSEPFVASIAVAMVLVQGADAVIGLVTADRVKTLGPAATAVVNLAALIWMLLS